MRVDLLEIEERNFKDVDKYYKYIYAYEETPVRYLIKRTDLLNGIRAGSVNFLIELCSVLFSIKKYDDAVNILYDMVENSEAHLVSTIAMFAGRMCVFAEIHYDATVFFSIVTGKLVRESSYELGKLELIDGDYDSAFQHFTSAAELSNEKANYFLAYLYNRSQQYDEAERAIEALRDTYVVDETHYPHMMLAEIYVATGRMSEARILLNTHSEGVPVWRHRLMGMVNKHDMKYEEAIDDFILASDDGSVSVMIDIGDCYLALGNYEKAEEYYTEAGNRGDNRAINAIAGLHFRQGRDVEAIAILNRRPNPTV